MSDKLKPCPFCGNKSAKTNNWIWGKSTVNCVCGAQASAHMWNKRHGAESDEPTQPQIDVYSHRECTFRYCPTPGLCRPIDGCIYA